jgi:N-acetylglutamate synthase-like GNAT family acetyltransferase
MISMGIYRAGAKDIETVLFVINKSNSEAYRKIIPKEYFKEPVLTPDELLKEFEKMTFYAYRINEGTIGVAALVVKEEQGQLRWVYVLPEYQRKGVGTSLIEYIEGEAVKMKLKKLRVMTSDKADWAKSFYSKLGYRIIDRIPRPWVDDVVYEKPLTQEE